MLSKTLTSCLYSTYNRTLVVLESLDLDQCSLQGVLRLFAPGHVPEYDHCSDKLTVLLNSNVKEIFSDRVAIQTSEDVIEVKNEAVIVSADGMLPTAFLQEIGIQVETKWRSEQNLRTFSIRPAKVDPVVLPLPSPLSRQATPKTAGFMSPNNDRARLLPNRFSCG